MQTSRSIVWRWVLRRRACRMSSVHGPRAATHHDGAHAQPVELLDVADKHERHGAKQQHVVYAREVGPFDHRAAP
eukprot:4992482-Prymnesium_polylepis.1